MKTSGIQLIAEFIGCRPAVLNDEVLLKNIFLEGIERCGFHPVTITGHKYDPIGVTVVSIINESHIAIHTYPEAHHASIDIFHCSTDSHGVLRLLEFLKSQLQPKSVRFLQMCRGNKLELSENNAITSFSRHGFEVRYQFNKKLYDENSRYQKIEVIENETFGRMLFLDGDLQIAEYDVELYNRAMVAPLLNGAPLGHVAILGGGDGGVLSELLKHNPARVSLVDIDAEVVAVSKRFFYDVCGYAFEQPNVQVIVDDANKFLQTVHNLDAVIYDLTAEPELLTRKDKRQFLQELCVRIHNSLKGGGILSMQCCSKFDSATLRVFKETVAGSFSDFSTQTVFIPSFCEPWIFASAIRR
ncbi:MAG: adenosylmethionine decarboxylase [bacterium]